MTKPIKTTTVSTNPEGQSVTTQTEYRRSLLDQIPWGTLSSIAFAGAFIIGAFSDMLPQKAAIIAAAVTSALGIAGRVAWKFAERGVNAVVTPINVDDDIYA